MKRVHKALKLRHHKHTGKILAHKHTSYRVLFFLMLAPILLMTLVSQWDAAASDIDVNATVPAEIPSGAPAITSPNDNTTFAVQNIDVSGTCPIATPAVIVTLYDNNTLVGSGACDTSGTFSIQLSLSLGSNSLVATVVTFTGQTGASSPAVTITRVQPKPPTTPAATDDNSPPASVSLLEPLLPTVRIVPTEAFVAIRSDGKVTWSGRVDGGTPPYKLRADWGDGSADQRTVPDHSLQTFTHTYKTTHVYTLLIKATDVRGVTTILQSAAVTSVIRNGNSLDKAKYQEIPPLIAFVEKNAWYIYIAALSALVFLWYLEHGRGLIKKNKTTKHRVRHV